MQWFKNAPSSLAGSLVVVSAAVVAAVALAAFELAGVSLEVERNGDVSPVSPAEGFLAAALAGLVAWSVAAWLGRRGWARWWPFVASAALSLSMLGPAYLSHGEATAALSVVHFAVGAVLIVGFAARYAGHACEPASKPARHSPAAGA